MVIVEVPPIFNVPVAPLVKPPTPPTPASAVATVNVPLFVVVPDIETDGIAVVVEPLIVFAVPLKVCTPVLAVNVVALFVKLPAIL